MHLGSPHHSTLANLDASFRQLLRLNPNNGRQTLPSNVSAIYIYSLGQRANVRCWI